jgi:hypothetical protein
MMELLVYLRKLFNMKKIVALFSALLLAGSLLAQGSFDVKATTSQVIAKLTPALSLSAEQATQTIEAVADFLAQKATILPLQSSDPSGYASKFNQLNGTLVNKLKTFLQAKQMTTFWSLKPRSNDPGNVLSHLFF